MMDKYKTLWEALRAHLSENILIWGQCTGYSGRLTAEVDRNILKYMQELEDTGGIDG